MRYKVAVVSAVDMTIRYLLWAQIESMQRVGYEVHSVCSDGPNGGWLTERGVRVYPVTIRRSISPFSDIIALWKMFRYFRRNKIQIVHTHTPKCSLLGQLAAKLAGVPVIINTIHGFYFHEHMKPWTRRFYIMMEWIAARCSTMILCQNPEDIETAVRLNICKCDNIELLGNGVDLSKFDSKRFNGTFRTAKRCEIGVPKNAIVVGIVGRLVREKGYLELAEAMKKILHTHKDVWLLAIGPEEPEKPDRICADIFSQYSIAERTRWLGPREDISELLACIDIYTLPSWREGFPRSAIEAAAMAVPIVATNIRGCRQVVDDGVNGYLVSPRAVDELAEAIVKLVQNSDLRLRMGKAGYEKARREFDEANVCKIVIDTYRELLCDADRSLKEETRNYSINTTRKSHE